MNRHRKTQIFESFLLPKKCTTLRYTLQEHLDVSELEEGSLSLPASRPLTTHLSPSLRGTLSPSDPSLTNSPLFSRASRGSSSLHNTLSPSYPSSPFPAPRKAMNLNDILNNPSEVEHFKVEKAHLLFVVLLSIVYLSMMFTL